MPAVTRQMIPALALATGALLAACTASDSAPDPTTGNAALGVASFQVTQTGSGLDLQGVSAAGVTVARVQLRVGHVEIPDIDVAGLGRDLRIQAGGYESSHTSVGLAALSLPAPDNAQLHHLMADPYVAHVLERWNIEMAAPETAITVIEEAAYTHGGSCAGFTPPCQGTTVSSCSMEHAKGTYADRKQNVVCGDINTKAERRCKSAGAATSCGTAGPAGCAVCWNEVYPYTEIWTAAYLASSDSVRWIGSHVCGDGRCDVDECSYQCTDDCGWNCVPN